jgi:hypothetical protein
MNCKHENKVYDPVSSTLTSMPPIHIRRWICKDCGLESEDRTQGLGWSNEYAETKAKFGKSP